MKITDEMVKQSYRIAKKVYDKEIGLTDGARILCEEYKMNDGSAKDFINNYRYLRTGQTYARTMNGNATIYFLQNILNDFGYEALQTALLSVDKHIKYYESLKHGSLNNIREIYNSFIETEPRIIIYNEYNDEEEKYFNEGKAKKVLVNVYERDIEARKKCIDYYGYKCFACGVILSDIYGKIANNFIHVHHIIELSSIKEEYNVDPIKDLRPLCPNCHSIVHRKSPALSIEELIELIKKRTAAIRGGG